MAHQQTKYYLAIANNEVIGEYDYLQNVPRLNKPTYLRSKLGNWFVFDSDKRFACINNSEIPDEIRMLCCILDIPI